MRKGDEMKSAVVNRVYYSLSFSVLLECKVPDTIFALINIAKSKVN
jgi:hypothetical protein